MMYRLPQQSLKHGRQDEKQRFERLKRTIELDMLRKHEGWVLGHEQVILQANCQPLKTLALLTDPADQRCLWKSSQLPEVADAPAP